MGWLHLLKRPRDLPRASRPFFRDYRLRVTAHIANSRCIICDTNRFLYFRVPKAANSTVVATLYKKEHGALPPSGALMKRAYRRPDSLNRREAREVRDRYFKFSFVRNPYDRFLSAYLDKIQRNKRPKRKVAKALKVPVESAISIDRFLDYLQFERGTLGDAHWAIQTDIIFMPLAQLDFLGRVENITNDLPEAMRRIFGEGDYSVERFGYPMGAEGKRESMLNAEQLKRIHRIYEKDFDLLKYPA